MSLNFTKTVYDWTAKISNWEFIIVESGGRYGFFNLLVYRFDRPEKSEWFDYNVYVRIRDISFETAKNIAEMLAEEYDLK